MRLERNGYKRTQRDQETEDQESIETKVRSQLFPGLYGSDAVQ